MAKKPTAMQKKKQTKAESHSDSESVSGSTSSASGLSANDYTEEEKKELAEAVNDLEESSNYSSADDSSENAVDEEDDSSISEETGSGSNENENQVNDEIERTIFIKGLDYDLTEAGLREQFDKFGPIVRVTVPKTYDDRRNKGFAYIEFENLNDAQKALKLDGTDFMGRKIVVNQARPKENKLIFTVFVRNLSFDTKKEQLQEYFSKFGEVYNVSVPVDPENENRNKGFAFVEYNDEAAANKAAEAKHKMHDRILYTSLGKKNEERNTKRKGDRLYGRKDGVERGGFRSDRNGSDRFERREDRGSRDSGDRKSFNRNDRNNDRNGGRFNDRNGGRDEKTNRFNKKGNEDRSNYRSDRNNKKVFDDNE